MKKKKTEADKMYEISMKNVKKNSKLEFKDILEKIEIEAEYGGFKHTWYTLTSSRSAMAEHISFLLKKKGFEVEVLTDVEKGDVTNLIISWGPKR